MFKDAFHDGNSGMFARISLGLALKTVGYRQRSARMEQERHPVHWWAFQQKFTLDGPFRSKLYVLIKVSETLHQRIPASFISLGQNNAPKVKQRPGVDLTIHRMGFKRL
jgi:hypothetical protein